MKLIVSAVLCCSKWMNLYVWICSAVFPSELKSITIWPSYTASFKVPKFFFPKTCSCNLILTSQLLVVSPTNSLISPELESLRIHEWWIEKLRENEIIFFLFLDSCRQNLSTTGDLRSTRQVSHSLLLERLLVFLDCNKTFLKILPRSSCEFYNCNTKHCVALVLDSPLFFFLLGMARTLAATSPCRYTTQHSFLTKPLSSFLHLTTWKLLPFFFSN